MPIVDRDTPYEQDVACQLFVATFAQGATLDSIADAIGVSRERVRQIETEALRKLHTASGADWGGMIASREDGDEDAEEG